ncbi:MAG: DNA methyltransferase [Planctomycetia bacterium]|nr:DNA methyltransferase [Planctomycetia bacterium]
MKNALMQLDRTARDLAKSTSFDWVKEIRDEAIALEAYAKSAAMERDCAVIRVRAERRLGELLPKMTKRGRPKTLHDATFKLGELGITRTQSSQFQAVARLRLETFERYLHTTRKPTTKGVLRRVTEQERAQQAKGARSGGNILTGPASQLWDKLADGSVDLFLTDPPYDRIDLYGELAELASAKLKTGCLCLAFCGQYHLPAVLETMAQHLQYHWTFAILFGGPHRAVYAKKIANTWHPVVAFSKGKCTAGWITDMLESGGREKDAHEWQKTLTDVEYLIEKLTAPGALVVDPYCGSGTVPAACRKLGRRWLACEIDSKTARVARGRIAA